MGFLWLDVRLGASISPGMGFVGRAVIGENPFDGDAAGSEPRDCPAQHSDRCRDRFVVVGLGMGNPGAVVDDGVHERLTDQRPTVPAAAAAASGRSPVPVALLSADEPVPAAVGDVAELGHIDVDHHPGLVVLVTAHYLTGALIDAMQPVQPASHQYCVDGRGRHPQLSSRSRPVPDAACIAGDRSCAPAPV